MFIASHSAKVGPMVATRICIYVCTLLGDYKTNWIVACHGEKLEKIYVCM